MRGRATRGRPASTTRRGSGRRPCPVRASRSPCRSPDPVPRSSAARWRCRARRARRSGSPGSGRRGDGRTGPAAPATPYRHASFSLETFLVLICVSGRESPSLRVAGIRLPSVWLRHSLGIDKSNACGQRQEHRLESARRHISGGIVATHRCQCSVDIGDNQSAAATLHDECGRPPGCSRS